MGRYRRQNSSLLTKFIIQWPHCLKLNVCLETPIRYCIRLIYDQLQHMTYAMSLFFKEKYMILFSMTKSKIGKEGWIMN